MKLPKSVQVALWSYDISTIDTIIDRELIVTNVLNIGTKEAVQWLFQQYNKDEIKAVIKSPKPGIWNKRSLNLWSLVFQVPAKVHSRF